MVFIISAAGVVSCSVGELTAVPRCLSLLPTGAGCVSCVVLVKLRNVTEPLVLLGALVICGCWAV